MKSPETLEGQEKVIGLVGNAACGKDTVAVVFEEFGFHHQSASDIVREKIKELGEEPNRRLQTETANLVRREQGEDYFAQAALLRARNARKELIIISGLYAPSEGIFIKGINGFLVEVKSMPSDTIEAQFHRVKGRSSGPRDEITFEDFKDAIQRENNGATPIDASVGNLSAMCDFSIMHDGKAETIRPQITKILGEIL